MSDSIGAVEVAARQSASTTPATPVGLVAAEHRRRQHPALAHGRACGRARPAGAQTRPEGRPAMTTNCSAGGRRVASMRAIHQPPQWNASASATGTSPRFRDASHQPTGSNGSRPTVHGDVLDRHLENAREAGRERARGQGGAGRLGQRALAHRTLS